MLQPLLSLGGLISAGDAACPLTCVRHVCALLDAQSTLQTAGLACQLQSACRGMDSPVCRFPYSSGQRLDSGHIGAVRKQKAIGPWLTPGRFALLKVLCKL